MGREGRCSKMNNVVPPTPRPIKDIHILTPGTSEATLYGQNRLCRCAQTKVSTGGEIPDISGALNVITMVFLRGAELDFTTEETKEV